MSLTRKQRTINNSIVEIDDVEFGAGISFVNWKIAAKKKLKSRELILLQRRQKICNELIVSAIQKFITDNATTINKYKYHLNIRADQMENDLLSIYQQIQHQITNSDSKIMSQCIQSIDNIFSKWNGYKPTKVINIFREYYQGSRRWFDSKKIEALAIAFWIPITKTIKEFARTAAAHAFCNTSTNLQKAYTHYLSLYVSKRLLEAPMGHCNARYMFLIPAMSYKTFIKQSPSSLNIEGKHKDIRIRYILSIYRKISRYQRSFETELEEFDHNLTRNNDSNAYCNNNNNSISHSNIFGSQRIIPDQDLLNTDLTLELNEPCDMFQSPSPPYVPWFGSPIPMMSFGNEFCAFVLHIESIDIA